MSYKTMTEEQRSEAIVAEFKEVGTDLWDVSVGVIGGVASGILGVAGWGFRKGKNGLHRTAKSKIIRKNADKINGFLKELVAEPKSAMSVEDQIKAAEERIKAAQEELKAMKKAATASSK